VAAVSDRSAAGGAAAAEGPGGGYLARPAAPPQLGRTGIVSQDPADGRQYQHRQGRHGDKRGQPEPGQLRRGRGS
jgi:hypothetical protein